MLGERGATDLDIDDPAAGRKPARGMKQNVNTFLRLSSVKTHSSFYTKTSLANFALVCGVEIIHWDLLVK